MAIPEHVKRQAMNAVSHRETTAHIRHVTGAPAPEFSVPANPSEPGPVRPLSEDAKRQAMDAVSHPETRAMIRLVKDTGSVIPDHTPTRASQRQAEKIAQLHKGGMGVDDVHKAVSKDNFGKEYGR
jgi:hypothetical protein